MTRRLGIIALVLSCASAAGCGKKGPPLPPLVTLPAPPRDFTALRRGGRVDLQFGVPTANADSSTPADLVRVDVYAMTGLSTLSAEEIIRHGAKVGSVAVNPPADPDLSAQEAANAARAVPAGGVEQGSTARMRDALALALNVDATDVRSYLAVGFNRRGRRGAVSPKVTVPLGPSPAPPGQPEVVWDEKKITVTWPVPDDQETRSVAYHVYIPGDIEVRLTKEPVDDGVFVDHRIEWDAERCYLVRAVAKPEGLTLESDASPVACVTLKDTFPPAAPLNLTVIAGDGAMNLIWDPGPEADIVGYIVRRAMGSDIDRTPITKVPIESPTFRDPVPAGARATYVVQAVDKAGNVSPMSEPVVDTAR